MNKKRNLFKELKDGIKEVKKYSLINDLKLKFYEAQEKQKQLTREFLEIYQDEIKKKIEYTKSSGNVYEDLDFKDSKERLNKAKLKSNKKPSK